MFSTSSCSDDPSASRQVIRLCAVVLAAASLGACAQSSVVRKSEWHGVSREAAIERPRRTAFVAPARTSIVRRQEPAQPDKSATTGTPRASQGLASFYSQDTETASGEKFDARELTAAHPSLPFGTRLRVTNVATGRSVTVRVNDRGPYVAGRVVDVSHSAAEALGMVGQGVAKVKLDVVQ
jgi:rare lipoprotein A